MSLSYQLICFKYISSIVQYDFEFILHYPLSKFTSCFCWKSLDTDWAPLCVYFGGDSLLLNKGDLSSAGVLEANGDVWGNTAGELFMTSLLDPCSRIY